MLVIKQDMPQTFLYHYMNPRVQDTYFEKETVQIYYEILEYVMGALPPLS